MQVNGHSDDNEAFKFSSNLLACMNLRKISRGKIAKDLGVNIYNIDAWCNGWRVPQPVNMQKLTSYLKCEVSHIFPKLEKEKKMKKNINAIDAVNGGNSFRKVENKMKKTPKIVSTEALQAGDKVITSKDKLHTIKPTRVVKVAEKPVTKDTKEALSEMSSHQRISLFLYQAKTKIAEELGIDISEVAINYSAKVTGQI